MRSDGGVPLEIAFEGQRIRLTPLAGADLVARDFAAGGYEAPLPRLFVMAVRRLSGLVIDVGANNGLYSILACGAGPGVRVRAFEPYAPVLGLLARNLALNGVEQRVTVEEVALSDRTGIAELHIPSDAHGLVETSCSLEPAFKPAVMGTVTVAVRRLDDVIGADVPTVIKVDIEGHELAFLEGARVTLADHRPIVFYEVLRRAPCEALTRFKDGIGFVDFRLWPDQAFVSRSVVFDYGRNHALVPQERVDEFTAILAEAGLRRYPDAT